MAEKKTKKTKAAGEKNPCPFKTSEDFAKAADGYFAWADEHGLLYDEAGMAIYLSQHNKGKHSVTTRMLRAWWSGEKNPEIQDAVQYAYMRIQQQISTDPRYQDKTLQARAIFLLKQKYFGGYTDRPQQEEKELTVRIMHDEGVDPDKDFA